MLHSNGANVVSIKSYNLSTDSLKKAQISVETCRLKASTYVKRGSVGAYWLSVLKMSFEKPSAQYPLSRDEHTAAARVVADIRQQLQIVSELFASRQGKESSLTDLSAKALVCTTLLEHELLYATPEEDGDQEIADPFHENDSAIVKAAYQK